MAGSVEGGVFEMNWGWRVRFEGEWRLRFDSVGGSNTEDKNDAPEGVIVRRMSRKGKGTETSH